MTEAEYERRIENAVSVVRQEWNRARGHLFGAAESFGLDQRHEDGVKSMIRLLTYQAQADAEAALKNL